MEIRIKVQRICTHNEVHPHTTHDGGWCVAGDTATQTLAELETLITDSLSDTNPRVPVIEAGFHASRIVDLLEGQLRPEKVVPR